MAGLGGPSFRTAIAEPGAGMGAGGGGGGGGGGTFAPGGILLMRGFRGGGTGSTCCAWACGLAD